MQSTANLQFIIHPTKQLTGQINIPGDKSISHRAIILSAIANGISEINGFLAAEDCLATLQLFRELGVSIQQIEQDKVVIHGVGLHGLKVPALQLDCKNSGTTMRLLTGLLAAQSFSSTLVGDSSLSRRPMDRVALPLQQMGAAIELTHQKYSPISIHANPKPLTGIHYVMPQASAQVKSCLLLAGLYATGRTIIEEAVPTRDHTERMLMAFGYPIEKTANTVSVLGGSILQATSLTIPGDISSAAFFLIGACIANNSQVCIKNVGVNPTRLGIIHLLKLMGANIQIENYQNAAGSGEPLADIVVRSAPLKGITIPHELISLAIDEFPALFIAAACAEGETYLQGAAELRIKETDRLQVMADGLSSLGISVDCFPDGIKIQGGQLRSGRVNSYGDHRVAMAFAMAGVRANDTIIIDNCANVATSFPNFVQTAQQLGLKIQCA